MDTIHAVWLLWCSLATLAIAGELWNEQLKRAARKAELVAMNARYLRRGI